CADAKCAFGCAYRLVSATCILLQFVAVHRLAESAVVAPAESARPRAGGQPARPGPPGPQPVRSPARSGTPDRLTTQKEPRSQEARHLPTRRERTKDFFRLQPRAVPVQPPGPTST